MLLGDLFHLPVQLHLLHAAVSRGAPLAVQATILASICSIVSFQLLFPEQTARTTATPWRDAAAFATSPALWLCYANHLLVCAWAACFYRGVGTIAFHVGISSCALVLIDRLRATWLHSGVREANEAIARAGFGMGLRRYTAMALLSALPHQLMRLAYGTMYVAIFGYGGKAESRRLAWELFGGYVLTAGFFHCFSFVYYTWHRHLHSSPLLYRAIHKWHHLYKPATPLSSGTELCLEYSLLHAHPCSIFPFWAAFTLLVDPSDIETHNTASWALSGANGGPRPPPNDWHLKHHLTPECNYGFSAPIDGVRDARDGSAKETDGSDERFVRKAIGLGADSAWPSTPLKYVSIFSRPGTKDTVALGFAPAAALALGWIGLHVAYAYGHVTL